MRSVKDRRVPNLTDAKLSFLQCDICGKPYNSDETKLSYPTSAVPEEELQQQEPILLLCDPCRQELDVHPTFNPYRKRKRITH
jgi:hypothetical protein